MFHASHTHCISSTNSADTASTTHSTIDMSLRSTGLSGIIFFSGLVSVVGMISDSADSDVGSCTTWDGSSLMLSFALLLSVRYQW